MLSLPNLLTTVARTVMNGLVGDHSFDEVIGAKRSDIAFKARGDAQRKNRLCATEFAGLALCGPALLRQGRHGLADGGDAPPRC